MTENHEMSATVQYLRNIPYQNNMLPTLLPISKSPVGVPVTNQGCQSVHIPDTVDMPEIMTYGLQRQQVNFRKNYNSSARIPTNIVSARYSATYDEHLKRVKLNNV